MSPTPSAEAPEAPLVPCPHCRKRIAYRTDNPWRPFCSERCRDIDLGAWASESFRVPAAPPADDDASSQPDEP